MGERMVSKQEVAQLAREVIPLFRAAINADPQSKDAFSYEALRNWARALVAEIENPSPYKSLWTENPSYMWNDFITWKAKAEQLLSKKP